MFKCIRSFLQISLAFISQNNLEPVVISGKRLNDNYVTIAHVISDQVAEAEMAMVQGGMSGLQGRDGRGARQVSSQVKLVRLKISQPREAPRAHRSVCFCKWNLWTSVLPPG